MRIFGISAILICSVTSVNAKMMPRARGCVYTPENRVHYFMTNVQLKADTQKNFAIAMALTEDGSLGSLKDLDCGTWKTNGNELFNEMINQWFLPHAYSISAKSPRGEAVIHMNRFFRYGEKVYVWSSGFENSQILFEITRIEKHDSKYLFFTSSKEHKVEDAVLLSVQLLEPGRYGKIRIEYPNHTTWKNLRLASGMRLKDIGYFLKQTSGDYKRENDFWGEKSEIHFAAYWGDGRYLVQTAKATPYYAKRESNESLNFEANTTIRIVALGFAYLGQNAKQTGSTECWVVELPDGRLGLVKRSDLPVQLPLLPASNNQ